MLNYLFKCLILDLLIFGRNYHYSITQLRSNFPIMIQKENIYLIGDAATQVKATTGGGIIPSLKAAHTLCNCIIKNEDYNKEFKKHSGRELLLHLKLRNILNKFSDKDYDYLLELMDQKKIKNILKKYSRDKPIPLVLNILLKEPRFLLFSKFALQ